MLHVGPHSAITRWSQYILPPNPREGDQARSKKVSVVLLKTGLFRHHQNGPVVALQLPLRNVIYPISCPMPATQRLCDLSQGPTISLGFSVLSCDVKTWTRKSPKSVPIPTVYNPDFPFHPMCSYPKLLFALTTNYPGQQKPQPWSLKAHGGFLAQTAQFLDMLRGAIWSVYLPPPRADVRWM